MRISPYITILDACVLVPMPIVDTLLRLAEEPAFYTPKWSPDILQEVRKTLQGTYGVSRHPSRSSQDAARHVRLFARAGSIQRRIGAMECTFPDAMVTEYEGLIPVMKNDPKDRHVDRKSVV